MKKKFISEEYIFCAFFIFVQLIGTILKINTQVDNTIHLTKINVLTTLLISIIVAVPISKLLKKMLLIFDGKKKTLDTMKEKCPLNIEKRQWAYIWGGMFLLWLLYFLSFYPGIFAYDIENQWGQYFGEFGYSTYHPIIHTLLMGNVIEIGAKIGGDYNKGVVLYSLIQLIILSGGVSYVLYYMRRIIRSKMIYFIAALYFMLFPVWPFLGISTTKDVFFSIFFLISFVFLLDACFSGFSKRNIILIILNLTLALLFRNNTIYGLVLVIIFLCVIILCNKAVRKKSLCFIGIFLVSIIMAKGIDKGLINLTSASEGSVAEMLSIPCQQIARVYSEDKETLTSKEKKEIVQYIPKNNIVNYRYQLSDPIKGFLNTELIEKDWKSFFTLWGKLGLKYPKEYLEATLCNTLPLWYIWDESMVTVHGVYLESSVKDVTDGKVVRDSKLPRLKNYFEKLFSKGYILKFPIVNLLFVPASYIWIIIAMSFLLIKNKQYEYLLLPIFLLSYAVTLLAGPCILPRYCMNFMLCVPLLLSFVGKMMRER